ncbi:MAG TPA: hypothetical protein VN903_17560 [Polyangia bacterium]|jgi:hypothetical protein|nr:hypothetical protein [Polyangia bacterium]
MLFGSAAVLAFLLAGSAASEARRQTTHLWLQTDARPRPLRVEPMPPFDLKSLKIVGATGVGAFVPLTPSASIGAAFTTLRTAPDHRAMQFVAAFRIRF